MAQAQQPPGEASGSSVDGAEPDLSRDTTYKMLANQRRRYTIHYLQNRGGAVTLGALAEQVGAWEHDTEPDRLTSDERKTVYTALQQRHLPKLDEAGLVEFDKRAGTVAPTESLTDLDIYTEVVASGEFPWSQYYLGLSTTTVALLIAAWADVFPLVMLPDIAWGLFAAVSFTVSAIAHVVLTREMKLGASTDPPEVDE
ncbi:MULTISPECIES: DUF7344 domain-containing protein [Salinibaculum]|uniref:DUF7344 domain-containing protein n=1 Tax=Salinibaculum TaxID=2732368 RepID=UPI0030D455ED